MDQCPTAIPPIALLTAEVEAIVRVRYEHGPIGDADQLVRNLSGHGSQATGPESTARGESFMMLAIYRVQLVGRVASGTRTTAFRRIASRKFSRNRGSCSLNPLPPPSEKSAGYSDSIVAGCARVPSDFSDLGDTPGSRGLDLAASRGINTDCRMGEGPDLG